jgi:hypothetical protein
VWEEHRLKVAGKEMVRRIFGRTEGNSRMEETKLFSEQPYNYNSSHNVVRVIKLRVKG